MEKDVATVHGGNDYIMSNDLTYKSLYSPFSPHGSASSSPSDQTSADSTTSTASNRNSEFTFSPSAHSLLVQEQQDLVNSHNLCFAHLRDATEEAEALRLENTTLRVANRELNKQLNLVLQSSVQKRVVQPDYIKLAPQIVKGFRGMSIEEKRNSEVHQGFVQSPTSVINHQSDFVGERSSGVERVSLPKSISIRSDGYSKIGQGTGYLNHGGRIRSSTHPGTVSPPKVTQRVYVEKAGEAVELETYDQGMVKTELCNKWQETGACPYGDHCQFAHGFKELRPVIRHPRYKTQVCRMVLAGDTCPYGHRCHFRHALTDQEKLVAAFSPTAHQLSR